MASKWALTIQKKRGIIDEYHRSGARKFGIDRCHVSKLKKEEQSMIPEQSKDDCEGYVDENGGAMLEMGVFRGERYISIPENAIHSNHQKLKFVIKCSFSCVLKATYYISENAGKCTLLLVNESAKTIYLVDIMRNGKKSWEDIEVTVKTEKDLCGQTANQDIIVEAQLDPKSQVLLTTKLEFTQDCLSIGPTRKREHASKFRMMLRGHDTKLFALILSTVSAYLGVQLVNLIMACCAKRFTANLGKISNEKLIDLLASVDEYGNTLLHRLVINDSKHAVSFFERMVESSLVDLKLLHEVAMICNKKGQTFLRLAIQHDLQLIKPIAAAFEPEKLCELILIQDEDKRSTLYHLFEACRIQDLASGNVESSPEFAALNVLLESFKDECADQVLLALDQSGFNFLHMLIKAGFDQTAKNAIVKMTSSGLVNLLTLEEGRNLRLLLPFSKMKHLNLWLNILSLLSPKELIKVQSYSDVKNPPFFDCLVRKGDWKIVESIWNRVDLSIRQMLLVGSQGCSVHQMLDYYESLCTGSYELMNRRNMLLRDLIIESMALSPVHLSLGARDRCGLTPLHKAAQKGSIQAMEAMLYRCDADTLYNLLYIQDKNGCTALHSSVTRKHNLFQDVTSRGYDCLRLLLESIRPSLRFNLLKIESLNGDNVLHHAVKHGDSKAVEIILHCLQSISTVDLIERRNNQNLQTVLYHADLSKLVIVFDFLTARERFDLLTSQDCYGDTVLHRFIEDFPLVKFALQSLDFHHDRVFLVNIQNNDRKTILELAERNIKMRSYLSELLRERQELETVYDQPLKDGKEHSAGDRWRSDGAIFPGYVDDILKRNLVSVTKLGRDELYRIYPQREAMVEAMYFNESMRLLSFECDFKSNHMSATSFAKAGLINHPKGPDSVACLWCQIQFSNFKAAIDVAALHMAYAESVCEFIQHYSRRNIPLAFKSPKDPPAGFLELPISRRETSDGGFQSLDSGFVSHIPTQNQTMSAAASALTFASPNSTREEATASSPPQENITDRFIRYEKRLEVIAQDTRCGLIPDTSPMRYEQNRLLSFINKGWSKFYSDHLASAGFYVFEESNDTFTIACPFCDGKITGVTKDTIPMFTKEKDHSPLQVHILKFPACAFIQGNNLGHRSNVPLTAGEFRWNQSKVVTSAQANVGSELVNMGVATTQADCPPMAVYERRCESFLSLPYDHPKGAEDLATCGFYNLGKEGKVKCFWCGVECGSWSSGEDVWVRHARSMSSCQFVINEKGAEFVNHVIEEHGEWIDSQRDEDRIRNVTTRMIRPRMDAPVVQAVISMGYTRDHVKTAIINRLKKLKPDYTSIADLVSDVLALRNKNIPYLRDLKLPDVPVEPKASILNSESQGLDGEDRRHESMVLNGAVNEIVEATDELASQQPETADEMEGIQPKSVLDLSPEEGMTLTRQMMSQLTCKICISSAVGIIFLPCAHLVCCTACAAAMTQCPMCRRDIAGTIKANV